MIIGANIQQVNTTQTGSRTSGDVVIYLFNTATGSPVNGNYVTVTFEQDINGEISTRQVSIAGQSQVIYSGTLADNGTGDTSGFFTRFQVVNVGQVPDPQPPVNTCDLAINFINVDNQESAPGIADGQITVKASSSYGPVTYSLDDVTFQLSATFTGLTAGVKNVYVKDGNGCTATGLVTVGATNSLLIDDPSVSLPNGNISRWNAAFNPVVFTYQRKDFAVTAAEADTVSGNTIIIVNCDTSLIKATLTANAQALVNAQKLNVVLTNINPVYVYISTPVYKGTFEVLSVTDSGKLLIGTPYASNTTGYININLLRPYYQVRTLINYIDSITGRSNSITSTNRPDGSGMIKADISNFLQSLLRVKDDSDFTQTNYRDSNLSASYQVAYAEYWDGKLTANQGLTYSIIPQPYYAVYAAKQLGDQYGGNLAANVPFKNVTDHTQLAKWITDFAEPCYSNNYPFDIGFIYGDDLTGLNLYCEMEPLDINRNPVPGALQNEALLNEDGSWLLNQDSSKLLIASAQAAKFPVPAQLGLNRLRISNNFDPLVYYFNLTLKYDDANGSHPVTQTQTVRIDNAIDEQSVYLRWVGLTGSWNYYRFVYNQEVSLDVQNAVIIRNFVSDWANQDSIEDVIAKDAGQKIKVMAEDLSVADIKGLQSIKYSPKVQMLTSKNPVKWQTIVINTATYSEYETLNGQAPFSITFNLPSINIQTQ